MKKMISCLLAAILLVMLSVPVLAYGGRGRAGGGGWRSNTYPVCTVENCVLTGAHRYTLCPEGDCTLLGPHRHDDVWYCGQAGWQDSYGVCPVEDCRLPGLHEHDSVYYYCAYRGTGRGCCGGGGGGWRWR